MTTPILQTARLWKLAAGFDGMLADIQAPEVRTGMASGFQTTRYRNSQNRRQSRRRDGARVGGRTGGWSAGSGPRISLAAPCREVASP